MRESDKREKLLEKMMWWPWANNGVFVMDQEETQVVINALKVLEARKEYQHKRYLNHMDEKKQYEKDRYEAKKAEEFRRIYEGLDGKL